MLVLLKFKGIILSTGKIFIPKNTLKGLEAHCHSVYFDIIYYIHHIHSITFIKYITPSSFTKVPLYLLIAGQLSGKNLPGAMPS
jgi:hypothetical protein